jgi:hypothetical protein
MVASSHRHNLPIYLYYKLQDPWSMHPADRARTRYAHSSFKFTTQTKFLQPFILIIILFKHICVQLIILHMYAACARFDPSCFKGKGSIPSLIFWKHISAGRGHMLWSGSREREFWKSHRTLKEQQQRSPFQLVARGYSLSILPHFIRITAQDLSCEYFFVILSNTPPKKLSP